MVVLVVVSYDKSLTWELVTIRAIVQLAGVKGTGQISRGLTRGQILPLGRWQPDARRESAADWALCTTISGKHKCHQLFTVINHQSSYVRRCNG